MTKVVTDFFTGKKEMSFEEALEAEYSEPATELKQEPEQPPVQNLPPYPERVKQATSNGVEDWRGNPSFYQSGRKAGQRRPKPLVSVAYEPTTGDDELTGELIGGAMFITMIDLFLPGLFVMFNNFVLVKDKKDMIKMEEMQLDDKTIKRLEPVADKSLRRLKLRGDPTVWLMITMLGCYGMRFATIKFERKLEEAMKDKEERK